MRSQLAVIIAFAVACVLGVAAVSLSVQKLDAGPSSAPVEASR